MTIARYWRENASRYNMIGSRCGNCGKVHFPTRTVCPECRRKSMGKMETVKLSGNGEVVTFSIVHDAPPQLEMQKPYVVAMIKLDEGPIIAGQVIDIAPSEAAIGMRVHAAFRKLGEEGPGGIIHYGYKFAPSR